MRDRRLLTQVLLVNLLLIVAAVIAAVLASNPGLALEERPEAAFILGFAVALTVLVNLFLLQRRFRPLERLVQEMERADLSRPGANLRDEKPVTGTEEVERLHHTFRQMLARLEAERRRISSAALAAQEEERTRIARDLHDEVNQSLTGLLLRLEAARRNVPDELGDELGHELGEIRSLANRAMEELLALARQLRPTALDDLGLKAALGGLVKEIGAQAAPDASFESEGDFSELSKEVQLVVYRVAQEALSNALQHAEAENLQVSLVREDGEVKLRVSDDGSGFVFDEENQGLGLAGMRERALLVTGELNVQARPEAGTRILLRVPIDLDGDANDAGAPSWDEGAAGEGPDRR